MKKLNWIDFYLLNVSKGLVSNLKPITTTDTFAGMTKNFHPEGLYSTEIFGPIGKETRDEQFAYIDMKLDIMSPTVALGLFSLKALYEDICSGRRYATWDEKEKDFEPALPSDAGADTGYTFFIKHFNELTPKRNDSLRRDDTLDFFFKFRPVALSRYALVYPAGLRDLMVRQDGRDQEDEVNPIYRRLITLARTVSERSANSPITDPVKWKLQQTFNEIWMYFFTNMDGKRGYARSKVTSRKVMNGTRNVLSSFSVGSELMGAPNQVRATDTRQGLLQSLKSLLPVAQFNIRERYLSNIRAGDGNLYGVNTKTLKREFLEVPGKVYDLFSTDDGIETLINRLEDRDARHKPVMVDETHYAALIYSDDDAFKVFYDIDELPKDMDKKYVSGITLAELLYLSGYDLWNDYFTFVTRYPVAGRGSTYSSTIRLETTAPSVVKYEINDGWSEYKDKTRPALSFPRRDIVDFVESMAVHPSRLAGLGGDHDGDMTSSNAVFSEESLEENRKWMLSRNYWFDTNGRFKMTPTNDVTSRTFAALLKAPVKRN